MLGAEMCAMAFPLLKKAAESEYELDKFTQLILAQLRGTMFLLGSTDIHSLANTRYILKDKLANMLDSYEFRRNKN
jgi:isopentenyl-diphosphate Delta-isomerase